MAKHLDKVVGIDIDEDRVDMARKNTKLYKVDNVEFIQGDVLDIELLKSIDADIALLDPGWSTRPMDRNIRFIEKRAVYGRFGAKRGSWVTPDVRLYGIRKRYPAFKNAWLVFCINSMIHNMFY